MRNIARTKGPKGDKHMEPIVIISLAISIFSLVIAVAAFWVQYKYAKAEYLYKLSPEFEIRASFSIRGVCIGEDIKKLPVMEVFSIETANKNNLDAMYIVDPSFCAQKINLADFQQAVKDYFSESFQNGQPDIADTKNDLYYYYRFFVTRSLDGEIDVQVLYCKASSIDAEAKRGNIGFDCVSEVELLEWVKGHKGDSRYDGEREIAKQYGEITAYFARNSRD